MEEGVRALDDGNPYKAEWQELNLVVQASIMKHKADQAAWFQERIKKCTAWMKRLQSLIKKIE